MSENVLHVENVTMQFGGVVAVNNLSLDIPEGKIVALIGPNGAGKTTAFNCITGVYEPTNGLVEFMGKPIVRNHPQGKMKKNYKGENGDMYLGKVVANTPDKITRQGIARCEKRTFHVNALKRYDWRDGIVKMQSLAAAQGSDLICKRVAR